MVLDDTHLQIIIDLIDVSRQFVPELVYFVQSAVRHMAQSNGARSALLAVERTDASRKVDADRCDDVKFMAESLAGGVDTHSALEGSESGLV